MAELKNRYWVDLSLGPSGHHRRASVASAPLDFNLLLHELGAEGRFGLSSLEMEEIGSDGASMGKVPCQYEPEAKRVWWAVEGSTSPGGPRRYRARFDTRPKPPDGPIEPKIRLEDEGNCVIVLVDGEQFTRYNYRDVQKPFLYPLKGPDGELLRGPSEEQAGPCGLFIAYGGQKGESADLWSEGAQSEAAGKMVHKSFEVIESGDVFGRIVERLCYQRPDGAQFAEERREFRFFAPAYRERLIDITVELTFPEDRGDRPVFVGASVAGSLQGLDDIEPVGTGPGRLTNSEGADGQAGTDGRPGGWTDFSGPAPAYPSGVALLDHPDNLGHPPVWATRDSGLIAAVRPFPADVPRGGVARLRYRVFVHGGDASSAEVAHRFEEFCFPDRVEVRGPHYTYILAGPEVLPTETDLFGKGALLWGSAKPRGIDVLLLGQAEDLPPAHAEYDEVYYVLEGEGEIEVGTEVINVRPGQLLAVSAGTQRQVRGGLRCLMFRQQNQPC